MAGNPPGSGPGNKSGKRSAKALAKERLEIVDQMLHKCYTHSALCGVLSKKWDIKPRQVQNYIRKVYQQWEEDAKSTLVDRVSLRRSQLEQVLEDAMLKTSFVAIDGKMKQVPDQDLRTAVQALDRLCKVDGAYAAIEVKSEVSGTLDVKNMTSNDKRKELARLLAIAQQNSENVAKNAAKVDEKE